MPFRIGTVEFRAFRIRRFARFHRSSSLVKRIAAFCEKFLHGYFNEGYFELHLNGESDVIRTVSDFVGPNRFVALDVGANRGEWTAEVLRHRPDANLNCFEIIPNTAAMLRERFQSHPNVCVSTGGLSNETCEIDVVWNNTSDDTSSISPRRTDPLFVNARLTTIKCKVESGDEAVSRLALNRIDLIKIDTEGHEVEVLQGFVKTLSSRQLAPTAIQFEYGVTYIPPRHFLAEVYDLLTPHGYVIGRLYPGGVEFKPYEYVDEHFRIGNYVAVHKDSALVQRMARF